MAEKETQKQRILKWFDTHDTLTRIEAYEYLGIFEAPARITELKQDGYEFETIMKSGKSKYGYPFTAAIWSLKKSEVYHG